MKLKKDMRLRCEGFPNQSVRVNRVAKDGTWVDVFVYDNRTRTSWTKRMPLPLTPVWSVIG